MKLNFFLFVFTCFILMIGIDLKSQVPVVQPNAKYLQLASYDTNLVFGTLKLYDDFIYGEASFSSTSVVFGGTSYLNAGSVSHLIYKMDTLGNVIWARQVEGSGASDFGFMTNDLQHHIYVGGHFDNDLTVQGQTMSSAGLNDIAVIKFDSAGNLLSLHQWGGILNDTCFGLAIDYAQNYYMWMTNAGNYSLPAPPVSSEALIFLKLDSSWNEVFVKWMEPCAFPMYPATKNKFSCLGLCYSPIDSSLVFFGEVTKGHLQFKQNSGYQFSGYPYYVYQYSGYHYFGDPSTNQSRLAGYLAKVDLVGKVKWTNLYSEFEDSYYIYDICTDDSANIYMASRFEWTLGGNGINYWVKINPNGVKVKAVSLSAFDFSENFWYAYGGGGKIFFSNGILYARLLQLSNLCTDSHIIKWKTSENFLTFRPIKTGFFHKYVGKNGEFIFFSKSKLLSTIDSNFSGSPLKLKMPHELKLCGGNSSRLNFNCEKVVGGVGSYSYQWSPNVGLSDATIFSPIFFNISPSVTTYTLTVTDAQGNVFMDTVRVSRFSTPQVVITTNPIIPTCNSNFTLIILGDSSYTTRISWLNNDVNADSLTVNVTGPIGFQITTRDTNQCSSYNYKQVNLPLLEHKDIITVCVKDLPFYWNGQYYTAAGDYSNVFSTSQGCDSTAKLTLYVKQDKFTTIDTQICQSSLPFYWNGIYIGQAGTYMDTLVSSVNCDSIVTFNVLLKEFASSFIASNSDTICANTPFLLIAHTDGNYCTPSVAVLDTSIHVGNVTINNVVISHPTINSQAGYKYYSTTNKNLTAGQYYSFDVTPYGWYQARKLWIDYNQDFEFSSNEEIYSTPIYGSSQTYIPLSAFNGQTRMRVVWSDWGYTLPCGNDWIGEYEDYNVTISGGTEKYTWSPISMINNLHADTINVQGISTTTTFTLSSPYGGNCIANFSKTIYVKDSTLQIFTDTICSNQLPFIWQGDSLLNSGTYTKLFTNIQGCDSTLVLNLHVNEADTIWMADTLCSNELPYVWQGQILTSSGSYSAVFQNQHGCDSLIWLSLTVNLSDTTTILDTVCSNQLPYMWQGQQLMSSGLYSTTLQNTLGCDSILNLNLTVNPSYNHVQYDSICSSQLPFIWQGDSLLSSGTYTKLFTNLQGCDSTLVLNLHVNEADTIWMADTLCSNELPYVWQGQQITASGLYSTTLQNALGCDSLLNLNLTVNPSYNHVQYDTICSNDLPYHWQEHFITSAGFYADTLQSEWQCDSILSLNLIVYDNYIGQLVQDGNRLFCQWNNLINYKWYFNGRLMKNNDTSLLITEPGNYELQAWSAEGCMVKFTTTVLEESFTSMHVYPNPAHTVFYIDFDLYLASEVQFKLMDVTGNVIKIVRSGVKLEPARHRMEFDLTDLELTNGIYFLERNDVTGSWIEKVSIMK